MKINELLNEQEQLDEIEPGEIPKWYRPSRYYGQGKQNVKTLKQDKQLAKQLYNQWNNYAVRINKALANDPQLVEKSSQYFMSFISKALRIPTSNPIFDEIENMLGANGINYNKKTAQQALDYAVAQRTMAMLGTPGPRKTANPSANSSVAQQSTSTQSAPPSKTIKTGARRKASDGQLYRIVKLKDGSREWHDLSGNRANDQIQQELGKKYGV